MAFTTLAWRDLAGHVATVLEALETGLLPQARQAVSLIVGRDTEALSEDGVIRATVETIAESTSDGVIAPLFYLALGGAPLALAYKAISTLDSMVGHPDERYSDLGWASAKLDDLANWIPARLSASLMVIAAGLTMRSINSTIESWRILRRDGHKHISPNSGRPEAAMAGALGIQLGGLNTYEGTPTDRPRLGDVHGPLVPSHIRLALRVTTTTYLLAIACAVGFSWL
jgi:adenosylcobinamide-phosphate synthase